MQIVIEIEDSVYYQIKQHGEISEFHKLIIHGTPLPKGHGRLIDADEVDDVIYKCFEDIQCYDGTGYDIYSDSKEDIDKIPTIIEADKESEE